MGKAITNRELIYRFFADKNNYNKVVKLCIKAFRNKEEAEDAAHNIYLKLYNNAATIAFPLNPDEVMPYLYETILHYRLDEIDKMNHAPQRTDESAAFAVEEDLQPDDALKLDEVDVYMKSHSHLFTEEQQKLWEYIYEVRSPRDKEDALGKSSNALYVARFRLLEKIRRHMTQDELI